MNYIGSLTGENFPEIHQLGAIVEQDNGSGELWRELLLDYGIAYEPTWVDKLLKEVHRVQALEPSEDELRRSFSYKGMLFGVAIYNNVDHMFGGEATVTDWLDSLETFLDAVRTGQRDYGIKRDIKRSDLER